MKLTDAHRREQERLHIDPEYGEGASYAPLVSQIVARMGVKELLDYGCGKARLMQSLQVPHELKIQCYDPGIPGFAGEPIPMQMVACVNVLEHVEPDCLEAVIDDLVRVTGVIGFIAIAPESGLIAQPMEWWVGKLMPRFALQTLQVTPDGFYLIVYAKPKPLIETIQ